MINVIICATKKNEACEKLSSTGTAISQVLLFSIVFTKFCCNDTYHWLFCKFQCDVL